MNPGSEIIEDEAQEREDMFEEQDRILEKEMDHSFSQNYPHSPEPHDRQEANIPAPGKWKSSYYFKFLIPCAD